MGKAASKISPFSPSSAALKEFNPEFDYRSKNVRQLKTAFKALKKSLNGAMENMEAAPPCFREIGTGYTNINACLTYSGGGGLSHVKGDSSPEALSSPRRMDRQLAGQSYEASKRFCTAMDVISENIYPKCRASLQEKVMKELDNTLDLVTRAIAQSKKTSDRMGAYISAKKALAAKETQGAKSGKDLMTDKTYIKLVADHDAKEKTYDTELEHFEDQYEELMAAAQMFTEETTEVFLDSVAGYYREITETIDVTDTPGRSRTRDQSMAQDPQSKPAPLPTPQYSQTGGAGGNKAAKKEKQESHEPTEKSPSPRQTK